ncbi:MAG: hypothetical protein OEW75_14270, partial [Cyclobacteriaceae bacterium]|nr:hypothetical protein [Cyclobacteriaceae bacterium]
MKPLSAPKVLDVILKKHFNEFKAIKSIVSIMFHKKTKMMEMVIENTKLNSEFLKELGTKSSDEDQYSIRFDRALVSGLYKVQYEFKRKRMPRIPRIPGLHHVPFDQTIDSQFSDTSDLLHDINDEMDDLADADVSSFPMPRGREEFRLDVDGHYPQMTASGTIIYGIKQRFYWIASLVKSGKNHWKGNIWYRHGSDVYFPYNSIEIKAYSKSFAPAKLMVTFYGNNGFSRTIKCQQTSKCFGKVEFEFDKAIDAPRVTSIVTTEHPNHPDNIVNETLTIEEVFHRSGFKVSKTGADGVIPLSAPGPDERWSNMEMHDAMQIYWSKFADKPQWALWVLFASMHEMGNSLGGIMFDSIGPNHRQGTAIFGNAFISNPPAGDPNPEAWVRRMRFWTAIHEMGHGFNLAHSWQKELGIPWISTLQNESEARSFMNYPYFVSGGQTAFFSDFEYRFSDSELLFMRHAPKKYVQMGNADWFDNHGFEDLDEFTNNQYNMEIRVNRPQAKYDFLEPIVLEVKLRNISNEPALFDPEILDSGHDLVVIIKKEGKPARQWSPYAKYCTHTKLQTIDPDQSIYRSFFISAGTNGWDLAEPGNYTLQVALKIEENYLISNTLKLKIAAPNAYEEDRLAQDFFNDSVGRVLALNGTRYFD